MESSSAEVGFSSITEDDMHIILWDFDIMSIGYMYRLERLLRKIQRNYHLSTIYLIKSRCGFNALCLDKFDRYNALEIKLDTSFSDKAHNSIGFKRNSWVLRLGEDKKLLNKLISDNCIWKKSNAHRKLLERFFNITVEKDRNFDNFGGIEIESYIRNKKK